jgi:hypothetical protein
MVLGIELDMAYSVNRSVQIYLHWIMTQVQGGKTIFKIEDPMMVVNLDIIQI